MNLTAAEKINLIEAAEHNADLDEEVYRKLYEYFCDTNQMPYGTAKARTGDPYEWIGEHLDDAVDQFIEQQFYDDYITGLIAFGPR